MRVEGSQNFHPVMGDSKPENLMQIARWSQKLSIDLNGSKTRRITSVWTHGQTRKSLSLLSLFERREKKSSPLASLQDIQPVNRAGHNPPRAFRLPLIALGPVFSP